MPLMKIGEVAKLSGCTVRTLHYYDELGLFSASHRSASGHRLYTHQDLKKLTQILSLRAFGFSLEEIRECLENPTFAIENTIRMHIDRLKEEIRTQTRVLQELEVLADRIQQEQKISVQDMIHTMEAMKMVEKYYTKEQLETLQQRREQVGEQRMQDVQKEWQTLYDQFEQERKNGSTVDCPSVQALAQKANGLIQEFTGGDSGIAQSLGRMYEKEGQEILKQRGFQLSTELYNFVQEAMAHAKR